MFTLAFLTDTHMAPLPAPSARELMSKRFLGYLNWKLFRNKIHSRPLLDAIVADMLAQDPDHIAVGGDLVNLSLRREFPLALEWLESIGPPSKVSLVPGNHDAYVPMSPERGIGQWRAYMTSNADGGHSPAPAPNGFPWVRRFGQIALIGLSSAVPKPPGFASGEIGIEQLEALQGVLRQLNSGHFRIVMVHHPPLVGFSDPRRGLDDAAQLQEILRSEGAELVLYGHRHFHSVDELVVNGTVTPVVGAPSASSIRPVPGYLARYALFRIAQDGRRCELTWRGIEMPGGPIDELERKILTG